jgi:4-carboxymuconolactone decarboxylase
MARTPEIDAGALNAADRKIYDAIAGPRGGMGGPFAAWFVVPEIAGHVNALVDRLRYGSKLDPRIYELVTLIVAHEWSAEFIWRAHAKAALKAGVTPESVAAIERGGEPSFARADERLTYEFVHTLLTRHEVDDELYARAGQCFGTAALVEIVTVAGYYAMNAMINKAFDVA